MRARLAHRALPTRADDTKACLWSRATLSEFPRGRASQIEGPALSSVPSSVPQRGSREPRSSCSRHLVDAYSRFRSPQEARRKRFFFSSRPEGLRDICGSSCAKLYRDPQNARVSAAFTIAGRKREELTLVLLLLETLVEHLDCRLDPCRLASDRDELRAPGRVISASSSAK